MMKRLSKLFLVSLLLLSPLTVHASLFDYYKSKGEALPSVKERSLLAEDIGIFDYSGTYEENISLESYLRDKDSVTELNEQTIGFSVVTDYRTRLSSSMTATQSTIPVASIQTSDGHTLTMSDLGGVVYLMIEPTSNNNKELVKCTSIVDSIWANCTRGLKFYGTDETSTAANRKSHNAGSTVVISNVHFVYEQLVDKDSNEDVAGIKTFTSNTLKLGDGATTTDKYVYNANGETNNPFLSYDESENEWLFSDNGVDTFALNSGGSGLAASSTAGIGISNSEIYVKPSTTLGMGFDAYGNLYQKTSSTKGLATDENGIYIKNGSNIIFDGSGNLDVNATSTPTASYIPISNASGTLNPGWVGASSTGDIVYTSSSGKLEALPIGTADQVLKVNASSTAPYWDDKGGILADLDADGVSYTNSSAERTLASYTVPANALSTGNGYKIKIFIDGFNSNGSAANHNFRLKYGATTLANVQFTNVITVSADDYVGFIEGVLFANGATDSQSGALLVMNERSGDQATASSFSKVDSGTAAEDSTGDLVLKVTVQISNAGADFTSVVAWIEEIKAI